MLNIEIPGIDFFDEEREEFVTIKGPIRLQLEHSLISISKWEAKWHKPFLGDGRKTEEETIDYIRCMTIGQAVDPVIYKALPASVITKVRDYIDDPMTASWISEPAEKEGAAKAKIPKEQITSELIYYWMIALNIPFECEKWHLSRLLMLIRICEKKNHTPDKKSAKDLMKSRAALNAKRKAAHHTRG